MTDRARAGAVTEEILDVAGVSVSLGGRQVLDNVSFTVGPGQFTGLIGPNGAGKTTLLRVILGLQRPTAGSVAVLGGHAPGGTRPSAMSRRRSSWTRTCRCGPGTWSRSGWTGTASGYR